MDIEAILSLEPLGDDRWRARTPADSGRGDIYGGQVAAQALRAAAHTVDPEYACNSVHCLFLRRGNPEVPLELGVEEVRTGRTYATRRVDVVQQGRTIFTLTATFHTPEPGRERAEPMPTGVPDPDELASRPPWPGADRGFRVFEMRNADDGGPVVRWWGRFPELGAADAATRTCALLYASDMRAGGAAMAAVGYEPGPPRPGEPAQQGNFGSLDHAVWFHRVPDVDDWFFCEVKPLTIRDARGLVVGTIFDRRGLHLASFAQEVFLKVPDVAGDA